jgi:leader peptidase (prepilin peptidase)/N-methyltransferase
MTSTLAIIFFVFGSIIGSFLNVVILRYNTHRNFGGRSACMTCKSELKPYDLIPVVSFCALKGRCRNCKTKISFQYPLVETVCGLIFSLLFLKFSFLFYTSTLAFSFTYAFYATIFSLLLVIAVYDIKHKIIPDMLAVFFGVLAFLSLFLFDSYGLNLHIPSTLDLLSGVVMAAPFALLWLVSKGTWMGLGDAKLAIGLGFLLGMSKVLTGLVLSFWTGAIVGIILMIFSKKYGIKSEIPFAPFLMFGTFLVFLFGIQFFPILGL